ncbi:ATP-binding protein [Nocardioides pacificus]
MTEPEQPEQPEQPRPARLQLSAPPDDALLERVHDLVEQLWEVHPHVPATDRARFETAVIEILGNIVEHAFALDGGNVEARRFSVVLSVTDTEVVGVLRDNGIPAAIDLSAVTMPDFEAESGRGLALAVAALDDLTYERVEACNHWTLTCRVGARE